MRLSEAQILFKDTMFDHPSVLDNPDARLAAMFETGDIPLPDRLKVYRNNIVGSLTDIMAATFPVIIKLVGRDFFDGMARTFILAHPPSGGCLSLYGAGFDAFIKTYDPAQSLAYLPDIAAMEIAINDSYYARDDMPMTAQELAAIPPEKLPDINLKFRDSVRFLESSYPLNDIRDFCLLDDPQDPPDINKGGVKLMIHRPEFTPVVTILDDMESAMAQALTTNPLGPALERVLNDYPDFDFQKFLQKNIEAETFLTVGANKQA